MDADDAVTSRFPEGDTLEISSAPQEAGGPPCPPHWRTPQGLLGLASMTAAAFWVSEPPTPRAAPGGPSPQACHPWSF